MTQPAVMNTMATKSYCQMKRSCKKYVERIMAKIIPIVALQEPRVRSRKGSTEIWTNEPRKMQENPRIKRKEQ